MTSQRCWPAGVGARYAATERTAWSQPKHLLNHCCIDSIAVMPSISSFVALFPNRVSRNPAVQHALWSQAITGVPRKGPVREACFNPRGCRGARLPGDRSGIIPGRHVRCVRHGEEPRPRTGQRWPPSFAASWPVNASSPDGRSRRRRRGHRSRDTGPSRTGAVTGKRRHAAVRDDDLDCDWGCGPQPQKEHQKEWGGGAQPQNAPGAGGRWGTFVFEVGGWA